MATEITKRLFTVQDYMRMADADIFTEDDRVELIYGEILAMSPIGPPHAAAVDRANRAMVSAAGNRAIVRIQSSVVLDKYSAPHPDIVLMRPREDFYASKHPGPSDIFLIVEVAESSLKYDRTIKARLYAETGIQEYWVADVKHDCLFVYSNLSDKSYRSVHQLHRGDFIAPQLLPECRLQVDVLLP